MNQILTKDISKELTKREGITQINIEPYEKVKITTGHGEQDFTGPTIIIVNQD
jgi:hypothetical protein